MEERIKRALEFAWSYGQINGECHKMWTIDQMVRALCGNPEEYRDWVRAYETPITDNDCYRWGTGVAPNNQNVLYDMYVN